MLKKKCLHSVKINCLLIWANRIQTRKIVLNWSNFIQRNAKIWNFLNIIETSSTPFFSSFIETKDRKWQGQKQKRLMKKTNKSMKIRIKDKLFKKMEKKIKILDNWKKKTKKIRKKKLRWKQSWLRAKK